MIVKTEWEKFKKKTIDPDSPPDQVMAMKYAFYHGFITKIVLHYRCKSNADVQILYERVVEELNRYAADPQADPY